MRRALRSFVDEDVANRIVKRWFRARGRSEGDRYRAVPVPRQHASREFSELTMLASFAHVHLAKEGHAGQVGFNLLEKIQIPTLPSLYGAMLAGVDWVLMGAGIPRHIPGALDSLADHRPTALPLTVANASSEGRCTMSFDPTSLLAGGQPPLKRPEFAAIVSSHVLAAHLAREQDSRPSAFVVERHTAGGHNAPPRGRLQLSGRGEPIYGPRDEVDLERMRELAVPFWLAGGCGHPEKVREALQQGACGVQVGTAFALCEESGLRADLKQRARERVASSGLVVHTDTAASPTGYPFKVAQLEGTLSEAEIYASRQRRCDLRYLATPYERMDGTVGYRCPAEPVEDHLAKGGELADTVGRMCLCNGLTSAAGFAQVSKGGVVEPPLLTLGDDASAVVAQLSPDGRPYSAQDVIAYLLGADASGTVEAASLSADEG